MNLVDGDGRMQGISAIALLHPVLIGPLVFKIPHQRCRARWFLMQKSEWVRLVHHMPVMPRKDVKLIEGSFGNAGNEPLPNARTSDRIERMRIFVPPVKAANEADGARIWRPHAEVCAGLTVDRSQMGAQLFISSVVAPLIEKIKILLSQKSHSQRDLGASWIRHQGLGLAESS